MAKDIFSQMKSVFKDVKKANDKATMRAMNKACSKTNTALKKELAKETGLKAKDVAKRISQKKATKDMPKRGYLSIGVKYGIALSKLKPKEKSVKVGKRKFRGVTVKTPGKGRELVQGAFMAKARSGKDLVLRRKSDSRYPIEEPKFSIEPIAQSKRKKMNEFLADEFVAQFDKQIAYELNKIK